MSRFARTSRGPLGQYDAKVDGFKFYSEAIDILRRKAAASPGGAIDLTEYLRRLCLVDAYGVDHLANLARQQYEAVRIKSDESVEAQPPLRRVG